MNKYFLLFACTVMMFACKSDYTKYVERELAKEQTNDSLFFGLKMGMTQKEFFDRCWKLNKEKHISQGPGGNTVKYVETLDSTQDQTLTKVLLFYGIFDKEKIMRGMTMTYSYSAWAPWTKNRGSDTLLVNLKKQFLRDYPGNDFMEIEIDKKTKAFAKVDGNRQILIYPKSAKDVAVKIEDLKVKYKK